MIVVAMLGGAQGRVPLRSFLNLKGLYIPVKSALKITDGNDKTGPTVQEAQLEDVVLHK